MPEESLSSVINNIRGAIGMSASHESNVDEAMFVNRKFHNEKRNGFQNKNSRFEKSYNQPTKSFDPRIKRCYCCKKIGCRSWKHTEKEQRDAKECFYQRHTSDNQKKFQQFLIEYEGITDDDLDEEKMILDKISVEDNEEPISGLFITAQDYDYSDQETNQTYTTSQYINNDDTFNISLLSFLQDQSVFHPITGKIPLAYKRLSNRKERYNDGLWQGVMVDMGAGKYSTAGYRQYIAYTRNFGPAELNTTIKVSVAFGKGSTCNSLGFINICTPIGKVDFHILDSDTPFLLCIADMKRLNFYLNNLDDKIYSKQLTIHGETYKQISSVKMKFGHPFIRWEPVNYFLFASCFITSVENSQDNVELVNDKLKLTEQQIRRLHKRFGHASVSKLGNLLDRAGYIKFRHHLLKIVNNYIFFIESRPVLHIIDEATRFQAAKFLKGQSTNDVWNAIRQSWIDVYVGPPDLIVRDAGKNFTSKEMQQLAQSIGTGTKCAPVEAHHSIGLVERYHEPQNDTAGPNGITPTILVFGTYPKISEPHASNVSIIQSVNAIRKVSAEIIKLCAEKQVRNALNQRNGPEITPIHNVPIGEKVWVWREIGKWTGPYTLLEMNGEDCIVDLPSGPTKFRSTSCKPYYKNENMESESDKINNNKINDTNDSNDSNDINEINDDDNTSNSNNKSNDNDNDNTSHNDHTKDNNPV
ncbi:hypothetical protein EV44_g3297 [Erysiphe necator]|uniref:Integrase catalytic domain-containing protein n=1 Tax=Uncinula necator TaxID=52586 RepID=A0A0B1NWB3_UNCNE|nr:hypothetical protein EV44_g3297 [Erysiphe necator]